MLVTVLTVAFNSEATIARTISSVMDQSYDDIEYIIVDGASSDGTVKIAESFRRAFCSRIGRSLRIISEPDNGMYDALNKGINEAKGKIVGSINSDDWYEPDAVKKMVALYKKELYDVAWGDLHIIKRTGDIIKHASVGKWIWTTAGFCHPGMFATKAILSEFPYACENMYDDFDMVTRVHQAGRKIVTLNEVIANFSFGGMSTQKSLESSWNRTRIRYQVYRKNGMSRLYWPHCFGIEMIKYLMS